MAYRYPKGAKTPTAIVTDVIATVAWIDFLLDIKLPHILFPIDMNKSAKDNGELYKKYEKFHDDVIQKMSYRQKIDMFFALSNIEDLKINGKILKTKRLFLLLGEFRNKIAHNPAMSLMIAKKKLSTDSVGYKMFYKQYENFHKLYKILEPIIDQLEKSLNLNHYI